VNSTLSLPLDKTHEENGSDAGEGVNDMKFEIVIAHKQTPEDSWTEEYEKNTNDPQKWAEETIDAFNSSLRPGEAERILIEVKKIDDVSVKHHTWKKTNLVTISRAGQTYDTYRCERCGITGKRYGLGDTIKKDSKFARAKVYQRCDTALAHLNKRKEDLAKHIDAD